ncbi:MAG: twin-arginine translocation signal domain-containing protein [Armatimonadetes bacterium]|nr:twin-arginine translocation signal domain-containing protein [Armatimonadota bacterium]
MTAPNEPTEPRVKRPISRRDFIKALSASAVAGGVLATAFKGYLLTPSQKEEYTEALADTMGKLPKRRFGTRMGKMEVTPIVMGQDWSSELYAAGLAAGINYVHKAGYWRRLPEEFAKVKRESIIMEVCVDSTPDNPDDEEGAYRQVTTALERTGLKYFDIFKAHYGWKTVKEMKEKRGTYRAFERLKKEGKVKYFGVSQHEYIPYPEIIAAQIEAGEIDSIQLFFTYGAPQATVDILEKAHNAGIGIMAMKVFATGSRKMAANPARMTALRSSGKVGRACYRHVLELRGKNGKPIVDCAVTNVRNFDQFEENIGAVALKTTALDGYDFIA